MRPGREKKKKTRLGVQKTQKNPSAAEEARRLGQKKKSEDHGTNSGTGKKQTRKRVGIKGTATKKKKESP